VRPLLQVNVFPASRVCQSFHVVQLAQNCNVIRAVLSQVLPALLACHHYGLPAVGDFGGQGVGLAQEIEAEGASVEQTRTLEDV